MLQFHRVGNFFSIISDTFNILVSGDSINEQLKVFRIELATTVLSHYSDFLVQAFLASKHLYEIMRAILIP